MIISRIKINGEVTDSLDLTGLDYEDVIKIQLSFPGHFNEKDILLKIKLQMIDHYTLFSGATRILMVHNLQNWESAEMYYYSRHAHHTHESVKFEELEP